MSHKAKPLPYRASALVDAALMSLSEAYRQIKPLLKGNDLETVARSGRALDEINQAIGNLREIKSLKGE